MPDVKKREVIRGGLAAIAEALLVQAHDKITSADPGGRGLALVGIGNALLAISCNLEKLDHPLREIDGPEMAGGVTAVSPYCERIGCEAVRAPAYLCCAEHAGLDTEGGPAAVVCNDCQRSHDHIRGFCGEPECTVCAGNADSAGKRPNNRDECVCCCGELVLEERNLAAEAVQHIARVSDYTLGGGGALSQAYIWFGALAGAAHRDDARTFDRLLAEESRRSNVQTGCTAHLRCGCVRGHHPDRHIVSRADVKAGGNNCSLGWERLDEPDKPAVADPPRAADGEFWDSVRAAAPAGADPLRAAWEEVDRGDIGWCGYRGRFWCAQHCPPITDDDAVAGQCCGEGFEGCSEHCS